MRLRGFHFHRRTEAASQVRPRIRRGRNCSARDGVGRILALPQRDSPEARGNGPAGRHFSRRVRRRRTRLHRIRHRHRRTGASRRLCRPVRCCSQFALFESHLQIRQRRAEAKVPCPPGSRQKARSLVAHRARSGFRRRWHPHDRGPRQQGLDFEWLQNLHHQWHLRRHLRGHGRHR